MATELRRALAERAAEAYVGEGARAVLLGGSVGRGEADHWSDIELGVFWPDAPTDEQRAGAIATAGGHLHRLWPYSDDDRAWFDDWFGDEIVVEPVHMTIADAAATVDDVVERHDPALAKQVLLAALTFGVPLAGGELLARWTRPYPDGLARSVVEAHAQIDNFWRYAMFRERGNAVRVAETLVDAHHRVLHALLAVNRVYWYGFKSLDSLTSRLAVAPPDLVARIRAAYEADDAEQLVVDLVEETYDLVERHVRGVDVDRLRTLFRYRRARVD